MSRKISNLAANAFYAGRKFKLQNTEVVAHSNGVTELYLHGNKIAERIGDLVRFTLAGWNTPTTRERLRALGINVHTKQGTPYYNGQAINSYATFNA